MTINTELTILSTTASNIKTQITNKGQTVSTSDTWASLPAKIKAIDNGGKHVTIEEILAGTVTNINDNTLAYIRPYCFKGCSELETAKFSTIKKIGRMAFAGCYNLKNLVLTNTTMVKLDSTDALRYTSIEAGYGNIYVTDNLVTAYKTDDTWKFYSNQILAVSKYIPV